MKKARIKNQVKKQEIKPTEEYTLKGMLKISIIVLLVFGIFYFITTLLIKPAVDENDGNIVFDSSKITLSQLLTRKQNEYYVIATKKSLYESSYIETNYIEMYNNYINEYKQQEDSLEFYYIDLDDSLNKQYISDELNITDEISNLKVNNEVLFKIKDGKIEKTYVGKEKIIDKLSRIKKRD